MIRTRAIKVVNSSTLNRSYSRAYSSGYSFFSTKNGPSPPKYEKRGNILWSSIKYANQIDNYQKVIQKVPDSAKVSQLLQKIKDRPEILKLLSYFLQELHNLNIDQGPRAVSKTKYRLYYALKLHRLHSVFWSSCNLLDISSHDHSLNFNPDYLGILDPKNFTEEDYKQICEGEYNGTKFKDCEIF